MHFGGVQDSAYFQAFLEPLLEAVQLWSQWPVWWVYHHYKQESLQPLEVLF